MSGFEQALNDFLASPTYRQRMYDKNRRMVELFEDGKWEVYRVPNYATSQYIPRGVVLVIHPDADGMRDDFQRAIAEEDAFESIYEQAIERQSP